MGRSTAADLDDLVGSPAGEQGGQVDPEAGELGEMLALAQLLGGGQRLGIPPCPRHPQPSGAM